MKLLAGLDHYARRYCLTWGDDPRFQRIAHEIAGTGVDHWRLQVPSESARRDVCNSEFRHYLPGSVADIR